MKTTLIIDTSGSEYIMVAIEVDGKRYERTIPSRVARAQTVLPLTEELLGEAGLTVRDITGIIIEPEGTSYTGLRVGFAIANALGRMLAIPINGKMGLAFPHEQPLHYKKSE